LQEIWDAERRSEDIGGERLAEVISEDSLPNQADDATDKNSGPYQKRRFSGRLSLRTGGPCGESASGFSNVF